MLSRNRARTLDKYTKKNIEQTRDVQFAVYLRPAGKNGKAAVAFSDCDNSVTVGSAIGDKTFEPGSIVPIATREGGKTIIGVPVPGKKGNGAPIIQSFPITSLVILYCNPSELINGTPTSVEIHGIGFSEDTVIRAVKETFTGTTLDSLVTIENITFVTSKVVTCDITISAEAPSPYLASLIALRG